MKATPIVTVITAVRNGASYLAETVASVQAQSVTDWEYIIVDDASNDETPEIVASHSAHDHRIIYLRRGHSDGPYVAANDALAIARGTYIFRIDADDLSPADRFERQLAFMKANRSLRACISFWRPLTSDGKVVGPVVTVPTQAGVLRWYWVLRSATVHSSACFERAAMAAIGGYANLPLAQDYRLWCEFTARGWLGVIPEVLSFVRRHPKRQSVERTDLQRELALDVLGDYLLTLTSRSWRRADLEDLFRVGHSEPMPIVRGIEMINLWEALWRADGRLTDEEVAELSHLSALRRWKHLCANARHQPCRAAAEAVRLGLLRPASLPIAWKVVTG